MKNIDMFKSVSMSVLALALFVSVSASAVESERVAFANDPIDLESIEKLDSVV